MLSEDRTKGLAAGAEKPLPLDLGLYDYRLPPELIAQEPSDQRDGSRLLHLRAEEGRISHLRFSDLTQLLGPEDVLVVNRTRVVPARLMGRKKTGGRIEALLIGVPRGNPEDRPVECLVKGAKGLKPGLDMFFESGLSGRVIEAAGFGRCRVEFSGGGRPWLEILQEIGKIPLPPYIKREIPPDSGSPEADRYQTVYARDHGAVAAPTAGLHFTPELLAALDQKGVAVVPVTLHVGYGTFEPLRDHHLETGRLHPESFVLSPKSAEALNRARAAKRRLVAVGTTTVRLLEHLAGKGDFSAGEGVTELFITPGFEFRAVGAMITNFHLPRTSLMMLVAALAGRELIINAYEEAVRERYRFFSFGDAMLIEPN